MSLPKKADVGPFRYTIHFVPELVSESGFVNTEMRRIVINGSLDPTTVRETLFHELMHAAIDITNLRGQDKDEEEKLVAALSPVLFAALRSNPRLLRFLAE